MCLQATVDLLDQVPAAAADAELCTELARICLLANYPVLAKDAIAVLSRTDSRLSTAQYTSLITGASLPAALATNPQPVSPECRHETGSCLQQSYAHPACHMLSCAPQVSHRPTAE